MKNFVFTLVLATIFVGCASTNNTNTPTNIQKPMQKFSKARVISKIDTNRYIIDIDGKEFTAISYESFKNGDEVVANLAGEDTIYIRPLSSKGGKTLLIAPPTTQNIKF